MIVKVGPGTTGDDIPLAKISAGGRSWLKLVAKKPIAALPKAGPLKHKEELKAASRLKPGF
ncbi:MAG: hypothetical protein CMJ47_14265 [Planctomyces sp.]|nr:hypothetical protein [Planctomyces sp.]